MVKIEAMFYTYLDMQVDAAYQISTDSCHMWSLLDGRFYLHYLLSSLWKLYALERGLELMEAQFF